MRDRSGSCSTPTATAITGSAPSSSPLASRSSPPPRRAGSGGRSRRHAAGMSPADAALDIDLGEFAEWGDAERIAVNVETIYAELDPTREQAAPQELMARMGAYLRGRRAS